MVKKLRPCVIKRNGKSGVMARKLSQVIPRLYNFFDFIEYWLCNINLIEFNISEGYLANLFIFE